MGKNTHVKIKKEGGKPMKRQSVNKTNFGRMQQGNHSMNSGKHAAIVLTIFLKKKK